MSGGKRIISMGHGAESMEQRAWSREHGMGQRQRAWGCEHVIENRGYGASRIANI
jgi:hypothetical protein